MSPDTPAGVDIPRLHFANMVGARGDRKVRRRACETTARHVFDFPSDGCHTQILIGRDVNHPGLRAESDWRPILAAPERWAEVCHLAGTGLSVRINLRASGLRVETLEHVLFHVRLALDEIDLAVRALKKQHVAVAVNVDVNYNCSASSIVCIKDLGTSF